MRLQISRSPNFNLLFQFLFLKNFFQNRTVFVFSESWLCNQLLQKAYCGIFLLFPCILSHPTGSPKYSVTCQNMLQYYTENCLFMHVTLRLNQRLNIELGGGRKIIGCEGHWTGLWKVLFNTGETVVHFRLHVIEYSPCSNCWRDEPVKNSFIASR